MTRRQFITAVSGALAGVAMIRPWRWRALVTYKSCRALRPRPPKTVKWVGNDGDWDNAANWSGGAPFAGDTIMFNPA